MHLIFILLLRSYCGQGLISEFFVVDQLTAVLSIDALLNTLYFHNELKFCGASRSLKLYFFNTAESHITSKKYVEKMTRLTSEILHDE